MPGTVGKMLGTNTTCASAHIRPICIGNKFPGLINVIFQYLESMNIVIETRYYLGKYLEFIGMRDS
ncbi:15555_t:CDS:2, partial [Dentiscutata heterogama]